MPRKPTCRPSAWRSSQAPYNFVSLPDSVLGPAAGTPRFDRFESGRLSGSLDLRITTETWLYIRAGVPPAQAVEEMQRSVWKDGSPYRRSAHHGDVTRPVLPGSSLRGMVRQLVEVISESALRTAPTKGLVYRAVGDTTSFGEFYRRRFSGKNTHPDGEPEGTGFPQRLEYPLRSVKAGYLFERRRVWFIQPTVEHHDESFVRWDERRFPAAFDLGDNLVWVKPASRTDHNHSRGELTLVDPRTSEAPCRRAAGDEKPAEGWVAGTLVKTRGLDNKHMHIVAFEPDEKATPFQVPDDIRRTFEEDKEVSRAPDRKGRWPLHLAGEAKAGWPCFYMLDEKGTLVYLGGTLFFRLPYKKTPAELALSSAQPDFASHLFGFIAESGIERGRLRFEDFRCAAVPGTDVFVPEDKSPRPLLAPKPACIQHYLVQPEEDKEKLRHYDSPDAEPRGFKHYWHRPGPEGDRSRVAKENLDPVIGDPGKIRTVIRPVAEGIPFDGRIHFDNLTREELGALLLALELPAGCRHKLGMGRPFGLGSIRLERVAGAVIDEKERYETFFDGNGGLATGFRKDAEQVFEDARAAFARLILGRQPGSASTINFSELEANEAITRLWEDVPRMRELKALLLWGGAAPPPERTAPVSIKGPGSDQWKQRKVLPPPTGVVSPQSPAGAAPGRTAEANAAPRVRAAPLEAPRTDSPMDVRQAHPQAVVEHQTRPARHGDVQSWHGATIALLRNPAGEELFARYGAEQARASRQDSAAILAGIPAGLRERLRKGETVTTGVTVKRVNKLWHLTTVMAE